MLVGVLSKDALDPLSIGAVGLTGPGDERDDLEKSDGPNINLLAGIGMVFGAAAFFVWARMRPVAVPERPHGKGFGQERQKTSSKT